MLMNCSPTLSAYNAYHRGLLEDVNRFRREDRQTRRLCDVLVCVLDPDEVVIIKHVCERRGKHGGRGRLAVTLDLLIGYQNTFQEENYTYI